MAKTLHILNGDSTAQIFKKSGIEGDVLVWHEMLCEGPLAKGVGSDIFWKKRYDFFEENLGVSKLDYYDNTIKNFVKLEDNSRYNNIVLWFEYDLFCQVNLLALCSFLLKYFRKSIHYALVCVGKEKGKEQLKTLSDYSAKAYKMLFENSVKLTKHNLTFADACWQLYVENNKEKLKTFDFNKEKKFGYLQNAINQHLKRFPQKNGRNEIENKILEIINSKSLTPQEIVKKALVWQQKETVYGFGDIQYFLTLKKLAPYYKTANGLLTLNKKETPIN